MVFHNAVAAALVAAVGFGFSVTATPLPYILETHCSVGFMDGTTSTTCGAGLHIETPAEFSGADGSNTIYTMAGSVAAAWVGYPLFEEGQGVMSDWVTNNLSFAGLTLGPVRTGRADILIGSEGLGEAEGKMGPPVSFVGFPDFVCTPLGGSGLCSASVPFTLGVPFGFEINTTARVECPPCGGWGEFADVRLSIWDAAGNPVPIYAASAVPEPGQLASVGLAFTVGVYATRKYRPRAKR